MICISSCDRYFATSDDLQCWAARTMQTVLHVLLYVLVYRTYSTYIGEDTWDLGDRGRVQESDSNVLQDQEDKVKFFL